MSIALSIAPTISAHCMHVGQEELAFDLCGGSADFANDARGWDCCVPSKLTDENRRVRSTECIGVTVTPGASVGTRNWVSPSPVRAVTSTVCRHPAGLDRNFGPAERPTVAFGRRLQGDRPKPVVRARLSIGPASRRCRRLRSPCSTSPFCSGEPEELSVEATTLTGLAAPEPRGGRTRMRRA